MPPSDPTDFSARRNEQLKEERRVRLQAERKQLEGIVELYERDALHMEEVLAGPHDPSLEEETKRGIATMRAYTARAKVRIGEIEAELKKLGGAQGDQS